MTELLYVFRFCVMVAEGPCNAEEFTHPDLKVCTQFKVTHTQFIREIGGNNTKLRVLQDCKPERRQVKVYENVL